MYNKPIHEGHVYMYWYYNPWYYRTRPGTNPWNPRNG